MRTTHAGEALHPPFTALGASPSKPTRTEVLAALKADATALNVARVLLNSTKKNVRLVGEQALMHPNRSEDRPLLLAALAQEKDATLRAQLTAWRDKPGTPEV